MKKSRAGCSLGSLARRATLGRMPGAALEAPTCTETGVLNGRPPRGGASAQGPCSFRLSSSAVKYRPQLVLQHGGTLRKARCELPSVSLPCPASPAGTSTVFDPGCYPCSFCWNTNTSLPGLGTQRCLEMQPQLGQGWSAMPAKAAEGETRMTLVPMQTRPLEELRPGGPKRWAAVWIQAWVWDSGYGCLNSHDNPREKPRWRTP